MPRVAREKSKTGIYHIILRAVNRQIIFEEDGHNCQPGGRFSWSIPISQAAAVVLNYSTGGTQPEGRFLWLFPISQASAVFLIHRGYMNQPRGRFLRLKIEDKNGRFKKGVRKCQG
jgi:hypothetical protein